MADFEARKALMKARKAQRAAEAAAAATVAQAPAPVPASVVEEPVASAVVDDPSDDENPSTAKGPANRRHSIEDLALDDMMASMAEARALIAQGSPVRSEITRIESKRKSKSFQAEEAEDDSDDDQRASAEEEDGDGPRGSDVSSEGASVDDDSDDVGSRFSDKSSGELRHLTSEARRQYNDILFFAEQIVRVLPGPGQAVKEMLDLLSPSQLRDEAMQSCEAFVSGNDTVVQAIKSNIIEKVSSTSQKIAQVRLS